MILLSLWGLSATKLIKKSSELLNYLKLVNLYLLKVTLMEIFIY